MTVEPGHSQAGAASPGPAMLARTARTLWFKHTTQRRPGPGQSPGLGRMRMTNLQLQAMTCGLASPPGQHQAGPMGLATPRPQLARQRPMRAAPLQGRANPPCPA